ncbi:MAG: hypothetical protein RL150_476 [Candidatus Parcubacteria bacterium]|jgi:type IV pilus assembly protein PilA
MKKQQGFTLIELLVVIAIIGILSSVVLASLNTARDKGADAAVKANLANARAQAELYYDDNGNSYDPDGASNTGVCDAAEADSIATNVEAAGSATGGTGACYSTGTAWAASAPLSTSGEHFCVDSTGISTTTAAALSSNDTTCE